MADQPRILWDLPLAHAGLGGIAATDKYVVFGDRDLDDFHDCFRCCDADTGRLLWNVQRLAIGGLDYGNSPRSTPLIDGNRVFCLGAHGALLCINLDDGQVVWEQNLHDRFHPAGDLPWGYCGSPLLVDGRLIVAPGAADASLVALNPVDGAIIWKSRGTGPSYGSLIVGRFGDQKQIVGHDAESLGGWDIQTGRRLWTVNPAVSGDFNVPTPVEFASRLLVTTENNGARLYRFSTGGGINAHPVAHNSQLRPNMSSPVVVNGRVYCVNRFLYCLDGTDGLKELWRIRDPALSDYAAIIASDERIIVVGKGQLLLLNADGSRNIIARQRIFEEDLPLYSHPAVVGHRLYIRGERKLVCAEW